MIVRLHTTAGVSRLTVPDDATLADLCALVEKATEVPADVQRLSLDQAGVQYLSGFDRRCADLGVTHGCKLHLVAGSDDKRPTIKATTLTQRCTVIKPEDLPPEEKRPRTASEDVREKAKEVEAGKGVFKSFESFLKPKRYEVSALPGSECYKPKIKIKGTQTKFPPPLTLDMQKYRHVDHLEYQGADELKQFVGYWQKHEMLTQRVGFMYGYYIKDATYDDGIRAVLEAIYEPPQRSEGARPLLLEDPLLETVDGVAAALGLERIGWIFTSLPRDQLLTSYDLMQAAKFQNEFANTTHYTRYWKSAFVTCHVAPDEDNKLTNAYMASDQLCAMLRDGILAEPLGPERLRFREATKDEVMPAFLERGKDVKDFDPDFVCIRVNDSAPKRFRTKLKHHEFPRENRQASRSPADLGRFLKQHRAEPTYERYSDFHLLIYIAELLGRETAVAIAECVDKGVDVDSDMHELISGLA